MAQDVWQQEGPSASQRRRGTAAALIALAALLALAAGVVLYLAPWADAAGGCGGG